MTQWQEQILCTLLFMVIRTSGYQVLDMTYQFKDNETIYFPGVKPFKLNKLYWGFKEAGYYYSSNSYYTPEHGGTHMDVPKQFGRNLSVDKIPVEDLVVSGVKVDFRKKAEDHPDALAGIDDLVQWEKENGRIPDNAIVLFFSGWGEFWKDEEKYLGLHGADGDKLSFPGLGPDAAEWLVKNRNIVGVGIDTASIDHGVSTNFRTHVILSTANKYILENVANMDKLPGPKGFTIVALPMKIFDGTGAPTRVLALYDDQASGGCRASTGPSIIFIVLLLVLGIFLKEVS